MQFFSFPSSCLGTQFLALALLGDIRLAGPLDIRAALRLKASLRPA